jgi:hypothetical protein
VRRKQGGGERPHDKRLGLADDGEGDLSAGLRLIFRMKPLVDQAEQPLQVFMKINAVFGRRGERNLLQVAQRFQAVAQPVGVVVNRQQLQLAAPRLGVETEDQAVDEY